MFSLIWAASVRIHALLQWAPSNLLINRIRSRRGLKWGVPAMLLAVPLLIAALACSEAARHGGPGWLNLVFALLFWDALKFLVMGPMSLVMLLRERLREASARRRQARFEAKS